MNYRRIWGRDLLILYFSMVVTRVGFGVIIIIFPSYILHVTDVVAAIALAVYPIFEAATAVPAGAICDRRGRKLVFILSLAYMAILMGLIGLTRNIYLITAIHALMGIGAAGIIVSSLTMITDLTHIGNRGAGMGFFDFANIGGYALGLLAGGRLERLFFNSLGYAFFVTAGILLFALLISLIFLREPPHSQSISKIQLNPLKALDDKSKAILPIWLSITALIGIVFFLPRALSLFGIGTGTTSVLLFIGVVVIGLGSIGFGALSDRIGRDRVLLIGIIGLFGLLTSVGLSLGGGGEKLIKNIIFIAPFALATSALVPTILATVGDRAREEMRGSAMGLYSVMLSGGIAFGTLVAGFAHSIGGLSAIIFSGAVIFLTACIISLLLLQRAKAKVISSITK